MNAFPPAAQSRIDEATLLAVQQQMAQQAAFAQIPDVVKRVSSPSPNPLIPLYHLTDPSSSLIFTKPFWTTTLLKLQWRTKADGIV